jgi:hypothetical protein
MILSVVSLLLNVSNLEKLIGSYDPGFCSLSLRYDLTEDSALSDGEFEQPIKSRVARRYVILFFM